MYPMIVKIATGTLDIKEYDLKKNVFIGTNDIEYSLDQFEYLIIPRNEMKKIMNIIEDTETDATEEVSNIQNKKNKYHK